MLKTITIEIPAEEAEQMQREIDETLRQTNALLERMRGEKQEVEPIQARTQANLEWLRNFKIAL